MNIIREYKYGLIAVYIIAAACLVLGGFYDYSMTEYLYNPQNIFGIIGEAFGFLPIYIFVPMLFFIVAVQNKNNTLAYAANALLALAITVALTYVCISSMIKRNAAAPWTIYLSPVVGAVVGGMMYSKTLHAKNTWLNAWKKISVFAFTFVILETAIIFPIKLAAGRDRFDDIISTGGQHAFANWFNPDWFSSGSSFPSGHTAAAMGILILLLVPLLFKKLKSFKWIFFVGCYIYAFAVGFSRMIMGRHFFSDVAGAIFIMTTVFILNCLVFDRIYPQRSR